MRASASTRVVMLGTGTPRPDPDRSGPATAVIVDGTPYLVDVGPGVVRRATAAFHRGVTALGYGATNVATVFLTHLHSDHTAGYPDLILTPWAIGRDHPLTVYGPGGIEDMTAHVLKAWQVDIEARTGDLSRRSRAGCVVHARTITGGVVHRDRSVTVTAFAVQHEDIAGSFGFRFEARDRTVVISGDTAPTQALVDHSRGCDILVHEAYTMRALRSGTGRPTAEFRRRHHTSSRELAQIANAVRPGLLVTYHRTHGGETGDEQEDVLLQEIRRDYAGPVAIASDLDVF